MSSLKLFYYRDYIDSKPRGSRGLSFFVSLELTSFFETYEKTYLFKTTSKIFQEVLTCNPANDRRLGLHEALSSQLEDSDTFQLHRPCNKGNIGD